VIPDEGQGHFNPNESLSPKIDLFPNDGEEEFGFSLQQPSITKPQVTSADVRNSPRMMAVV